MAKALTIRTRRQPGYVVVTVVGEVDIATVARLREAATSAVLSVNQELAAFKLGHIACGHGTLADIPAGQVGRSSVLVLHYRRAVYSAVQAELVEEYTERYANPYIAAERGYVDDVIDPADTRRLLASSLEMLSTKREDLPKRKHGNVPL